MSVEADDVGALSAEPDRRRALRRSGPLLAPHRRRLVATALVSLAATVATLAGPVLVGRAVDAVAEGRRDDLRDTAVGLAITAVAVLVCERGRRLLTATTGEAFLADLRRQVAGRLLARPLGFFERHPTGELLARATNDVDGLSSFVRLGLPRLVDATLLLGAAIVVVAATSWQLAAIALAYLPCLAVAVRRYRRAAGPAYAEWTAAQADTTAAVTETAAARPFLQGIGGGRRWARHVTEVDRRLLDANDRALRADNRLSILGWWQHVTLALVLLAGGRLVDGGTVTVGAVATVALALRQLFGPLDELSWLYADAQRARAHLARLLELLDGPDLPPEPSAPARAHRPLGIELVDVSHRYAPGAPLALDRVSVSIGAGEHVALVGPTGAGKSTLAKVAAGLLAPTAGTVRIGGVDVRDWDPVELRRHVVVVPQDAHVVDGTLADNLRFVPGEHTDDDLRAAVARAGLEHWVASLPDGLETPIAARGADLSAGERQLVALARAALADPPVVVLDETTADVDPATEAHVAHALDTLGRDRTTVLIAHRPATAARAQRVVVVVGGRVGPSPGPGDQERAR